MKRLVNLLPPASIRVTLIDMVYSVDLQNTKIDVRVGYEWRHIMYTTIKRISSRDSDMQSMLGQIYDAGISRYYPDFPFWFSAKVIPNINGTREVLVALNKNELAGFTILKKTETEKKICTLRVADKHRRQGIGTNLIKASLWTLQYEYPLMTVPEETIDLFSPLMRKFGFVPTATVMGVYRPGKREFYFNAPCGETGCQANKSPELVLCR